MRCDWVLLLEVACLPGARLPVETVEALLRRLAERYPSALHATDRCAVQFVVEADGPGRALAEGLDLWRSAAGDVGFPPAEVVRAEVKTPAELDAEYDADARTVPAHVGASVAGSVAGPAAPRARGGLRCSSCRRPSWPPPVRPPGGGSGGGRPG